MHQMLCEIIKCYLLNIRVIKNIMNNDINDESLSLSLSYKNSILSRRRRSSMFDPIDPNELEKRMYNNIEVNNFFF
jgi:hypothetical protein